MGKLEVTVIKDNVDKPDSLRINKNKKEILANLSAFIIEDGESIISVIPSLSISGYGLTVEDAHEMAFEGVHDYLESLSKLSSKELEAELLKYDWHKKSPLKNKEYSNSAYIDKEGVLQNLDLPKDTPIRKEKFQLH